MPQVAVKVSYRGLGPLLGRTAALTLHPALARTAKQPYARGRPLIPPHLLPQP